LVFYLHFEPAARDRYLLFAPVDIFSIFRVVSPIFRRRRMAKFVAVLNPKRVDRILDVGGHPDFWANSKVESQITVLNIHPIELPGTNSRMATVVGDGTNLSYPANSFDVVFSNSVIEHLGTFERQERFAKECARVGKQLWIQTPAKSFPIEPHFLTPFIHYCPKSWRRRVLRYGTVWGLLGRPSNQQIKDILQEIRLLSYREMRRLFPGCEILRERCLGLTKSYIAVNQVGAASSCERLRT
jgi:hypothetical protein